MSASTSITKCAVSRCRLQPLTDTTTLDIGSARVEVDLCHFHAHDLMRALAWLHEAAEGGADAAGLFTRADLTEEV
jgi:hypothetical protein